jgi:hypothetical protein
MFENTKRVEGHTKQYPCDKDRATRTQAKTGSEFMVSWGVINSCSIRNTRRVILVINLCHKWGKHQFVITTNRTHPWLFVTHILHSGYESHCDDFNLGTFLMRGTTTPTGTSDGCAVQIKYTNCSYKCIMNGYFCNPSRTAGVPTCLTTCYQL